MVLTNKWKERSYDERTVIFNSYIVAKIDNIIVWWCWLIETEINGVKWKIIECLFSKRTWLADVLLRKACAEGESIFAYSHIEELFIQNWFIKIDWCSSKTGADLYVHNLKNTI